MSNLSAARSPVLLRLTLNKRMCAILEECETSVDLALITLFRVACILLHYNSRCDVALSNEPWTELLYTVNLRHSNDVPVYPYVNVLYPVHTHIGRPIVVDGLAYHWIEKNTLSANNGHFHEYFFLCFCVHRQA